MGGSITGAANSVVDSDVNDPNAPYASNDQIANAQPLGNPGVVGGFASAIGTGVLGDRFAIAFDETDLFSVTVAKDQSINLSMGAGPTIADLDLYLYNSNGALVTSSIGTGSTESITVATAGTYLVEVSATSGISTYTLSISVAPASATVHDLNTTSEFIPGEVIVRFKDTLLPASAHAESPPARAAVLGMLAKAGGPKRAMLLGLGTGSTRAQALTALGVTASRATKNLLAKAADPALKDQLETLLAVKALRARADVLSADLNYIRRAQRAPNDPAYKYQWHYPLINLPQAWDVTTGSANVIVAVIDTGVFMAHPDLATNLTTGYDFISDPARALDFDGIDINPDDPGDATVVGQSSWHGTHVAGTIAATSNNNSGVASVAWLSKIMPLRVLGKGGGTSYDIMQAVRYAARLSNDSGNVPPQKADIINLSLGGTSPSAAEQNIYTQARNAGVIIIAAAGNNNSGDLLYPASYEGVVSVSAVDMNKVKAPYSNFGTKIDIAAPGGNTRVDLNNDGISDGVVSTLVDDSSGTRVASLKSYAGTSMASPHVAGVAALMVSVRKAASSTLTPAEFDTLIFNGTIVNDLGATGRDDIYGYGLIDAFKAVQAASVAIVIPTALNVNPTTLNFGTLADASTSRTLTVSKSGTGNLSVASVSVSPGATWLTVTETTVDPSTKLGTYTVTATKGTLSDGAYSATITFTTDAGTTVKVNVSLSIGAAVTSNANVGYLYVLLLNTETFDTVGALEVAANNGIYNYSFSGVPPGTYYIAAGSDMNNDGSVCDAGEACGAYPTFSQIGKIAVNRNLTGINFNAGFSSNIGINSTSSGTPSALKFSRRTQKSVVIK
ncbi:MAG: S8 family serine peptidase [Candidatus Nitrotoga sp.]